MGDWTLSSGSIVRPVRSDYGSYRIRHFQASTAASTARIARGDVVEFDHLVASAAMRIRRDLIASTTPSTGIIGIAVANDTVTDAAGTGLTTNGELGFSGTTFPNQVQVCLAAGTEFQAYTKGTSPSTLLGTPRVLSRDSTLNIWTVSDAGQVGNATATDRRIVITEVPYPGDTNGPVYFRFLAHNAAEIASSVSTGANYYLALGQ